MTGTEMFDAIAHIDEDLIEGCLGRMKARASGRTASAEAEIGGGKKPSKVKRAVLAGVALAAAVALAIGLIAILHIGGKSPVPIEPVSTDPPEQTAEPNEPVTAEPTPTPNILYGYNNALTTPTVPLPGDVHNCGGFTNEILESAEEDGSVFAVKIVVYQHASDELQEQLNASEISDPIKNRDNAFVLWLYERFSEPDENRKLDAFTTTYSEEALKDVLFEDYWRKNAPAEELAAYDAAMERRTELLDKAWGDAVREELARLQALGLNLKYEHGAYMTGYLTADQIRNFPAGDQHGFIIYWQLDPELTPERVEEMLNGEW